MRDSGLREVLLNCRKTECMSFAVTSGPLAYDATVAIFGELFKTYSPNDMRQAI